MCTIFFILKLSQESPEESIDEDAYVSFATSVAELFGAEPFVSELDIYEMLILKTELNSVSFQ